MIFGKFAIASGIVCIIFLTLGAVSLFCDGDTDDTGLAFMLAAIFGLLTVAAACKFVKNPATIRTGSKVFYEVSEYSIDSGVLTFTADGIKYHVSNFEVQEENK